ncbi:putative reverse transcriptase domain-containing protein [Tanacetum coccineum]
MCLMEIEQIIVQRVTNAIYETRTRVAHDSMDQVARQGAKVGKGVKNKRKWESGCDRKSSQQQSKQQKVAKARVAGPNNKRGYAGKLPSCNKCKLHHFGPCPVKCKKCQKVHHHEKDYRVRAPATGGDFLQNVTCFGCGEQGHYKNRCLRLKNQNHGDQKGKVSPWKGVVRFDKKGKLAPRYVGPFEIVERVGPVAYRLRLPQELSCIHDTFYVSNLKKCMAESDVQVPLEEIEIDKNLRFVEQPIEIVDRDVKKLKRRRITLVKLRLNSRQGAKYTWEREDQFKTKVPLGGSTVILRKIQDIEAIENVVENESHFSLEVVDDGLSSLAMLIIHFGKVNSMGGMGSGSLAIRSIVSNDGRGGGGKDSVEGAKFFEGVKKGLRRVGAGGGEVNGGGVDLGVSKRLPLEVAGEMIGESGGIEVGEVGGGADT